MFKASTARTQQYATQATKSAIKSTIFSHDHLSLPLLPPSPPVFKLDEGLVAEKEAVTEGGEPGQVVGDEHPPAGDEGDVCYEEHQ